MNTMLVMPLLQLALTGRSSDSEKMRFASGFRRPAGAASPDAATASERPDTARKFRRWHLRQSRRNCRPARWQPRRSDRSGSQGHRARHCRQRRPRNRQPDSARGSRVDSWGEALSEGPRPTAPKFQAAHGRMGSRKWWSDTIFTRFSEACLSLGLMLVSSALQLSYRWMSCS